MQDIDMYSKINDNFSHTNDHGSFSVFFTHSLMHAAEYSVYEQFSSVIVTTDTSYLWTCESRPTCKSLKFYKLIVQNVDSI